MREGKDEGFFKLLEIDERVYGKDKLGQCKGNGTAFDNSYYRKMMSGLKKRSKNRI